VRRADVDSHPATAKAWSWFEENAGGWTFAHRERIFLSLALIDAELWKLDRSRSATSTTVGSADLSSPAVPGSGVSSGDKQT